MKKIPLRLTALVTLLLLILTACADTGTAVSPTGAAAAQTGTPSAPSSGADAVTAPVSDATLSIWRVLDGSIAEAGYTSSNDTPGFIAWQEQSGIQAQIQEYADETALVLAVTAGTLPDIIVMNYTKYNGGIMGLVDDDLVIELTEQMLSQYAPDYWAYINKDLYLDEIVQLDGKMYGFSGHVFEEGSIYRYWKGFIYRQDILDALGLQIPKTNDEFYQLLTALKQHPGMVTPLIFQGKTDPDSMLENGYISSQYGLPNCAEYQVDGVYHYGSYEPAYQEVLRYMNLLYKEGLISVDYLTMESATAQAMLCTGEAGVFFGNNSRLNTFLGSLEEGGVLVGGDVLHGPDQSRAMFSFGDPMVSLGDWAFISADSKNPELSLQFLNHLYTPQGNLLRNMGIEGESYEMIDGRATYTELVTNNPDGYSLDGVARSYGLVNWPGIHADIQLEQRHPEQSQVDAYYKWADTDRDVYVMKYANVLDQYLNDYTNLWTDIELYIDECRAKFISGEMDIETEFDAYLAHLKSMGMDQVIQYKQKTLDAYNAR